MLALWSPVACLLFIFNSLYISLSISFLEEFKRNYRHAVIGTISFSTNGTELGMIQFRTDWAWGLYESYFWCGSCFDDIWLKKKISFWSWCQYQGRQSSDSLQQSQINDFTVMGKYKSRNIYFSYEENSIYTWNCSALFVINNEELSAMIFFPVKS